jgi:hypothetical protein
MSGETEPGDEPPAEKPKYDQAFFLELAAKGKDAWNAWRQDPEYRAVYRINFTGARIRFATPKPWLHWTEGSRIPIRLRALRKIAEETKNHDLERDLYIEERKAERGVYWRQQCEELKAAPLMEKLVVFGRLAHHFFWIIVMGFYWALADYGRSFAWPTIWLCLSVPLFHCGYGKILAPLMQQTSTVAAAAKYADAVRMVARANAVPLVGPLTIDVKVKEFLFCPRGINVDCPAPIPPDAYQWLVLGQNIFSIILVFFIGLALRNYFKIK